MGLEKLVILLVVKTTKSTVRFDSSIDKLFNRLKDSCPSKEVLDSLTTQKNQLSAVLSSTQNTLNTLNSIGQTMQTISTSLSVVINVIKNLPIPTSFPPGAGIPISIIVKFSDVVAILKDIVEKGKGISSGVIESVGILNGAISQMQAKLNSLDLVMAKCYNQGGFDMPSSLNGALFIQPNLTTLEGDVPAVISLEDQLSPSSLYPIIYKDYKLVTQTDITGEFNISRRRVIGIKDTEVIISKLTPEGWSYSSDLQVLVDDIKFTIDYPDFNPSSALDGILQDIQNQVDSSSNDAQNSQDAANAAAAAAAAEALRGFVKVYRDDNFINQAGPQLIYGEYANLQSAGIFGDNGISSLRVGRGLILTIFKGEEFKKYPQDDNDYFVFEHPLDSEDEYLEIPSLTSYNFNDSVASFIIDKTLGGLNQDPPEPRTPIPADVWILKKMSRGYWIRNEDWSIIAQKLRYDTFVRKNSGPVVSSFDPKINLWVYANSKPEAIQKFIGNFNIPNAFGPPFEAVYYREEAGLSYEYSLSSGIHHVYFDSTIFYTEML